MAILISAICNSCNRSERMTNVENLPEGWGTVVEDAPAHWPTTLIFRHYCPNCFKTKES